MPKKTFKQKQKRGSKKRSSKKRASQRGGGIEEREALRALQGAPEYRKRRVPPVGQTPVGQTPAGQTRHDIAKQSMAYPHELDQEIDDLLSNDKRDDFPGMAQKFIKTHNLSAEQLLKINTSLYMKNPQELDKEIDVLLSNNKKDDFFPGMAQKFIKTHNLDRDQRFKIDNAVDNYKADKIRAANSSSLFDKFGNFVGIFLNPIDKFTEGLFKETYEPYNGHSSRP